MLDQNNQPGKRHAGDDEAIDWALRLIRMGVPVFTAKPANNHIGYALPVNWQRTEADESALAQYAPGDALCMVTGHALDVIDVDPRNGGVDTFQRMLGAGALPYVYAEVETPRGGTHFYVAGLGVPKAKHGGVDLQAGAADGTGRGFVFLPGTRRNGGGYKIQRDVLDEFDGQLDGAEFLSWWRAHTTPQVTPAASSTPGVTGEVFERRFEVPVLPGGHDDALAAYAMSLASRYGYMPDGEVLRLLRGYITEKLVGATDDWSDRQLLNKYASGRLKTARQAQEALGAPLEADEDGVDLYATLDLRALLRGDLAERKYLVGPAFLPAGAQVVLYSPPKLGKSILSLEIAAAIACGQEVLGYRTEKPRHVLYVDHENDQRTLSERMRAMGLEEHADQLVEHLHYASFPVMPKLDTPAGGATLLAMAKHFGAELVIIDTVSRCIEGDENSNDTWLRFYAHTGQALKRAGIALLRLDHSGKDEARGQRGGSAKGGDVDAVWILKRDEASDLFTLHCDFARFDVSERDVVFERLDDPRLHSHVQSRGLSDRFTKARDNLAKSLDDLGAPLDVTQSAARSLLKAAGVPMGGDAARKAAIEQRQRRAGQTPS